MPESSDMNRGDGHNLNGGSKMIGMDEGGPPPPFVLKVFVFEKGGAR
jgi:hypothetical protein